MLAFFGRFPTIEAEALGTSPLFLGFCQLSVCIEDITKLLFWLVQILSRRSGYRCRFCLWGCRGSGGRCRTGSCARRRGWEFLVLPLPVSVVAFKSVNLELLKGSGSFQVKELILDPFSKTTVKFTI